MFRNANGQEPGAVTPIKKSAGGDRATTTDFKNDSKSVAACDRLAMVITPTQTEPRIDSRLLARHFGKRHQSLFELVKRHRSDFEAFGILRFQTGEIQGRGQPEKFALLNEDQCYLLLTYSRNTARVRQLKVRLVKAFREARRAADVHRLEYLPSYHQLHDGIKVAAGGSPNERFMHMNANRLLNELAGVKPGQRQTAGPLQQSLLAIGCALAAKGLQTRNGEKVHECIKTAVKPLAGLLALDQKEGS